MTPIGNLLGIGMGAIRNDFLIASSLAYYEMSEGANHEMAVPTNKPGVLDGAQFEAVAQTTLSFDRYLAETRGKDDGELAADAKSRGQMRVLNTPVEIRSLVSNSYSHGRAFTGNGPVGRNSHSPSLGFRYPQDPRQQQAQLQLQWSNHDYPQNYDGPAMAPSYAQQYGRPPPGSDYPSPAVSSEPPVPSWRKQPQEGPPPVTDEAPVPSWRKQQPPAPSLPSHGHDTPPPGIVRQGSYLGHGGPPPGPGAGYGGYDGGGYQQRPMMSQSGHSGNY